MGNGVDQLRGPLEWGRGLFDPVDVELGQAGGADRVGEVGPAAERQSGRAQSEVLLNPGGRELKRQAIR